VEAAIEEYELACGHLGEFISRRDEQLVSRYLMALSHFEICVSLVYQAYLVAAAPSDQRLFVRNDASAFERLNRLYNNSKHLDEKLSTELPPDIAVPLWLTNEGLETRGAALRYVELADLLDGAAKAAAKLAIWDLPISEERPST
jgi:hypothetical protein